MKVWMRRWPWLVIALCAVAWLVALLRYPSDRTVEGSYLRVMTAVNEGKPEKFFAYLETEAQHACFTVGEYRQKSRGVIEASYPPAEREAALQRLGDTSRLSDGPEVFAYYAERRGWLGLLRKDMSGIASLHVEGERASVETVRGTRYPFRRRDNGIWGLTSFTADLVEQAERAARDLKLIESAADDYRRAATTTP